MTQAGCAWAKYLADSSELAEKVMDEQMSAAVEGNSNAALVVELARSTVLLTRVLRAVRVPSDGDRRILARKRATLEALLAR
jgi:hypothetical protein